MFFFLLFKHTVQKWNVSDICSWLPELLLKTNGWAIFSKPNLLFAEFPFFAGPQTWLIFYSAQLLSDRLKWWRVCGGSWGLLNLTATNDVVKVFKITTHNSKIMHIQGRISYVAPIDHQQSGDCVYLNVECTLGWYH